MKQLNELGDTFSGQKILGRLSARKEYGKSDEKGAEEVNRYAREKRKGRNDSSKLSNAFCFGNYDEADKIEDRKIAEVFDRLVKDVMYEMGIRSRRSKSDLLNEKIGRVIRSVINEWDDMATSDDYDTLVCRKVEAEVEIYVDGSKLSNWDEYKNKEVIPDQDGGYKIIIQYNAFLYVSRYDDDNEELEQLLNEKIEELIDNYGGADGGFEITDYKILL